MKKLLFIALLFPALSYSQFKTVPDSLRCITPTQVTMQIENAFLVQHLKETIKSKDNSIMELSQETDLLNSAINSQKTIIDLNNLQKRNLQNDINTLTDTNVKLDRKIWLQKWGLKVCVGVIIVEGAYIGVSRLVSR